MTVALTSHEHHVETSWMCCSASSMARCRPISGESGSGMHLHQRSEHFFDQHGKLTPEGRSFIAGQLAHASALTALDRRPSTRSGGCTPGPRRRAPPSGARRRSALIRVGGGQGVSRSIEYRGADPLPNPYLVLAGLLTTGACGIDAELDLEPPTDEGTGFDPASARRFVPLPRNLEEALDALMRDDLLVDLFDPALLTNLVDGRRGELDAFRAHVTSWERDHYLNGA